MATEGKTQRRRSTAKAEEVEQEAPETAAEPVEQEAVADDVQHAADSPEPPVAADPIPAAQAAVDSADEDQGQFPVSALVGQAEELLGYPPEVVRGVLTDAPDPITIAEARERVEAFMAATVSTPEEA